MDDVRDLRLEGRGPIAEHPEGWWGWTPSLLGWRPSLLGPFFSRCKQHKAFDALLEGEEAENPCKERKGHFEAI